MEGALIIAILYPFSLYYGWSLSTYIGIGLVITSVLLILEKK